MHLSHRGLDTKAQHISDPANSLELELVHAPEGDNGGDGHRVTWASSDVSGV